MGAPMDGFRLGAFQGHALGGPPLALVAFALDAEVLAALLVIGAAVGWMGWRRFFGLRLRVSAHQDHHEALMGAVGRADGARSARERGGGARGRREAAGLSDRTRGSQ